VEQFTLAITLNPGDSMPYLLMSRTYATVGDWPKALQYAETAVTNNPMDANLRGNLGVMYSRNSLWPDAVSQLTLVVNGGVYSQRTAVTTAATAGRRILRKQAASRQAAAVQIGSAAVVTGGAVVAHDAALGRTADVEIESAALTVRPAILHGTLLKRSGTDELDAAAVRG
jgi:hypothetical protein